MLRRTAEGNVLGRKEVPMFTTRFVPVAAFLFLLAGCPASPPVAPMGCGGGGQSGITACSGITCSAGQYCEFVGRCTPGCTSDSNCGPGDYCVRPAGQAVGACESCPVCGNNRCDSGETSDTCSQDCVDRTLAECASFCNEYRFFECFAVGGLESCTNRCNAATAGRRIQFNDCAEGAVVMCDLSCINLL
jgi:hypothetical protein